MRIHTSLIALLFALITGASVAHALTQYWDIDSLSRAGAGSATPTGVWSSFTNSWNSDSTGLGFPTKWTDGNTAVFAAGTNATGSYTVNVSGTVNVGAIVVEEGFPAQNNGNLAFGTTVGSFNVETGAGFGQLSSSAVISGTSGVIKNGAGVLALRGTNTFSSTGSGSQAYLTIKDGIVDFQTDANLGAVPLASDNAAALTINGGTLRYSGNSAIALAAKRGVTIGPNGGTIQVLNSTTFALAANAPAAAALSGSGTITKTGDGRFRLQTAQTTFTGKYIVEAGSLVFPSEDRLGALPATTQADYFTLDGGGLFGDVTGVTLNAKRGITLGAGGGNLSFAGAGLSYDGIISGTLGGALSIAPRDAVGATGTGPVLLNAANTYNGPTLIGAGATLSVGLLTNGDINSGIGSSSNAATNLILDGGTLLYRGGAATTDRNFTITVGESNFAGGYINASGANNAALTFTNTAPIVLSGPGAHSLVLGGTSTGDNILSQAITDSATGATTLSKTDAGTWVLKNTANAYTGSTAIGAGGRLKLGASGVIPDASIVQLFSSATFDLNGFDETVRSVSGASGTIALGTKTLTLNNPANELYSAAITGTGGGQIIKNGGGKLTLAPTSATFDGGLTLNAGTLGVGTNTALGTGTLIVNNSPTLAAPSSTAVSLNNAVTLNGNITINDSFVTNPGSITWTASGTNKWTITGGERLITVHTIAGGYGVTINQPIAEDVPGRGFMKFGNGTLTLTGANTYTGNTSICEGTLSVTNPTFADSAAVLLNSAAKLNLNFAAGVVDTVYAFYVDGVSQFLGTWGAIGSGADHESALFTGAGRLNVLTGQPPVSNTPLAGDFNNDGKVDMGDYVAWQKANGTNHALLNDNGLGVPVGQAHLQLWRQHFGSTNTPGSGLGGGTIPEPTSLFLAFGAIVVLSTARIKRASHQ